MHNALYYFKHLFEPHTYIKYLAQFSFSKVISCYRVICYHLFLAIQHADILFREYTTLSQLYFEYFTFNYSPCLPFQMLLDWNFSRVEGCKSSQEFYFSTFPNLNPISSLRSRGRLPLSDNCIILHISTDICCIYFSIITNINFIFERSVRLFGILLWTKSSL